MARTIDWAFEWKVWALAAVIAGPVLMRWIG